MEGTMVDLKTVFMVSGGIILTGGVIIRFFQMQTTQNIAIKALEKKVGEIENKQSVQTGYQIETEKNIVLINSKLDHILEAIADLKKKEKDVKGNNQ